MALNLQPMSPRAEKTKIEELPRQLMYSREEAINLIRKGERVFGVPGASLSWGVNGQTGGVVQVGEQGEVQIGKILAEYAKKHPNVRVFNSIEWPGSKGDTDHMLVCGNQVLIIDAKRWKSQRKYSVTAKGEILRGTVAFPEGKVKILPSIMAWKKELGNQVKIAGVVCIAQEKTYVSYDANWYKAPFRLVTAEKLEGFLDDFLKRSKPAKEKSSAQALLAIMLRVIAKRDRRSELIRMT